MYKSQNRGGRIKQSRHESQIYNAGLHDDTIKVKSTMKDNPHCPRFFSFCSDKISNIKKIVQITSWTRPPVKPFYISNKIDTICCFFLDDRKIKQNTLILHLIQKEDIII